MCRPNSLGPEVISGQLGIIDVHHHPGVLCLGAQNLGVKVYKGRQSRVRRIKKSSEKTAAGGAQQAYSRPCRSPSVLELWGILSELLVLGDTRFIFQALGSA